MASLIFKTRLKVFLRRAVHSGGWGWGDGEEGGETVALARKTKQGVYAIINHDNFKQEASVWFVPSKVLEATLHVKG